MERLQREAARLGITVSVGGAGESGLEPDPVVAEAIDEIEDTEPEPAPVSPAPRPRRTRKSVEEAPPAEEKVATVTPIRTPEGEKKSPLQATPADDVTLSSDIEVIQEEDGWANIPDSGDGDDGAEDW
jgi:hypothetical protein